MRLLVARCEVSYTGRLTAFLPEAVRLLMIKSDGSVLVHADSGGYRPSNWMTPPTVIEEGDGLIVVRKRAGKTEDRLEIRIAEVPQRPGARRWTRSPGWRRTASRSTCRRRSPTRPTWLEEELRLDRREWMTEIGPVDLMCRDCDDGWVAVEIKRVGTIEAVEQLTRYLGFIRVDPAKEQCRGILAAQSFKPQAVTLAESRGIRCVEVDLAVLRGEREPDLTLFGLVLRLAVAVLERLDPPDHAEPAPEDLARARVPAHVVRLPRAVDEHRHAIWAGTEGMADAGSGRPRDHMAGADRNVLTRCGTARLRDRRGPELERRVALEDDEDLLVLGMAVRHRAAPAWIEPLPVEACLVGALRRGESRCRCRAALSVLRPRRR